MGLTLDNLLKKTMAYLNDYNAIDDDDDNFGDEQKELLKTHIETAARIVAQAAPASAMEATTANLTAEWRVRPDKMCYATVTVPEDYMRLLMLYTDELVAPVTQLLPITHPTYIQQYNPVAGVGAGKYNPKAYMHDGKILLHAVKKNVTLTEDGEVEIEPKNKVVIYYLAVPTEKDGEIGNMKDVLEDPVALHAAGLYMALTNKAAAKDALEAATAMMRNLETLSGTLSLNGEGGGG